jgi:hypothetical protein
MSQPASRTLIGALVLAALALVVVGLLVFVTEADRALAPPEPATEPEALPAEPEPQAEPEAEAPAAQPPKTAAIEPEVPQFPWPPPRSSASVVLPADSIRSS